MGRGYSSQVTIKNKNILHGTLPQQWPPLFSVTADTVVYFTLHRKHALDVMW